MASRPSDTLGEPAPDHRLSDDVRSTAPRAEIRYEIADDQTDRYAEASGDFFEIHLDDEAARAVGLPGRIVHGLCTMALTGRAVLDAAGLDDPGASQPRRPLLCADLARRHRHDRIWSSTSACSASRRSTPQARR